MERSSSLMAITCGIVLYRPVKDAPSDVAAPETRRAAAKARARAERKMQRRDQTAAVRRLERDALRDEHRTGRQRLKALLKTERDLRQAGDIPAAIAALTEAVALAPERADLHLTLGQLHLHAHRSAPGTSAARAAVACLRQAASLNPRDADTHERLADAWLQLGEAECLTGADDAADAALQAAIASFRDALACGAGADGAIQIRLADALLAARQLDEAYVAYQQSIAARPSSTAWLGRGFVAALLGRPAESVECYQRALAIEPNRTAAAQLTVSLLLLREIDKAWDLFRSVYAVESAGGDHAPPQTPVWRGEPLSGTRALIVAVGGIGDEVRFASCYGDMIAAAGECAITCEPRLASLMARSFPATVVHPQPRKLNRLFDRHTRTPAGFWDGLPRFDYYCTGALLPAYFRRRFDDFRRDRAQWLVADPARRAVWAGRLRALGPGPRVGLCWTSGVRSLGRRVEYTALGDWLPVLQRPGVTFVNLHYGGDDEIRALSARAPIPLHHFADLDLRDDLENVAALVSELDLVISAATFVGELAGALGVRTWRVINSRAPSNLWRVFPGTSSDVWCPSMIEVHGEPIGDVEALMRTIARALEEFAAGWQPDAHPVRA
jgi:tetratricopeptide (TPR) repeat protein